MFVDFDGKLISYNFRQCAVVEENRSVVLDLNKLHPDFVDEFVGDGHAFLSVLRAHGYRDCSIIMSPYANGEDYTEDFQEMGFTIL